MTDQEHIEELAGQDRLWKERRMTTGHGAQDGSARKPGYKALIIVIAGPIKHWWDENWMTPAHIEYDEWRSQVEEACVAAGFLVYKPYSAFKGTWNEEAQPINNAVVRIADVLIVLTPPGVPSNGTDREVEVAKEEGKSIVHAAPGKDIDQLIEILTNLADAKNA